MHQWAIKLEKIPIANVKITSKTFSDDSGTSQNVFAIDLFESV